MRAVAAFPREKVVRVIEEPEPRKVEGTQVLLRMQEVGICEAARTIEGILRQKILDPVGPEFMAPPTRPDVSARSPQPSPRQ